MDLLLLVGFSVALLQAICCCILHCYNHFECRKNIKIEWSTGKKKNKLTSINNHGPNEKHEHIHFGHDDEDHNNSKEAKLEHKPSLRQRMRASSVVLIEDIKSNPRHNNCWCCHIKKQKYMLKYHLFCCIYSSDEMFGFNKIAITIYFILLILMIIIIYLNEYFYKMNSNINHYCFITNYVSNNNIISAISSRNIHFNMQYICILIVILWETLLNFYRFYTMKYMKRKLILVTKVYIKILCLYLLYILIFSSLCFIQIYLLYAIFPIIILIHLIFNIVCIHGFISVLIGQYKYYTKDQRKGIPESFVNDMKHTKNKLMICSILCIIISTLYLTMIQMCYNSNLLLLYAPFWCIINGILWNLSLAKNTSFIKYHCIKLCNCQYKYCVGSDVRSNRSNSGMIERSGSISNRYLNNKKQKKITRKSPKFPNFMIMQLRTGSIQEPPTIIDLAGGNSNKFERERKDGDESLIPTSKTPSLIPYSKNIESPLSLPRRLSSIPLDSTMILSPTNLDVTTPTQNQHLQMMHKLSNSFKYPDDEFSLSSKYRKRNKALDVLGVSDELSKTKTKTTIAKLKSQLSSKKTLTITALHVPATSEDIEDDDDDDDVNDDNDNTDEKQVDIAIQCELRKQSMSALSGASGYANKINTYKKSQKQQMGIDSSSHSVFELMVNEGFYNQYALKSLIELQDYTDKQQTNNGTQLENNLSNVSERHLPLHPKPLIKQQSSHL